MVKNVNRTARLQWKVDTIKNCIYLQCNWGDTFWGILGIFSQTISTPNIYLGLGFEFGLQRIRNLVHALKSFDLLCAVGFMYIRPKHDNYLPSEL